MITFLKLNIIFFFDVLARKATISWVNNSDIMYFQMKPVLFKNWLSLPVQVNKS